jgi:hypothetical protein
MLDYETIAVVALAPFYAMGVYACWWGMNYGQHKLQQLSESAQQTQMTATTSPPAQVSTSPAASAGTKN